MTELKSANLREIDSFGARGDCTYDKRGRLVSGSDDSAALKDAFTWQQSGKGRKLLGSPGAVYLLMEEISGNEDLFVDWRGAEVFKASSGNAFRFSAPYQFGTLTTDQSGAVLEVDGLSRTPQGGEAVMLLSNAIDPYNRDEGGLKKQFRVAEWTLVGEGGNRNRIPVPFGLSKMLGSDPHDPNLKIGRVDERLIPAFTTAMSTRVMLPEPRRIDWSNLTLRFEDGHGAGASELWTGAGLLLSGYRGAVTDVRHIRGYGPGVQLAGCVGMLIARSFFSDLEDNTRRRQYGYGVNDLSFMTHVVDCSWKRCRHGFTTAQVALQTGAQSAAVYAAAGSRGAVVEACAGHDFPTNAPFDTHHGAMGTTFLNCRASQCATYAFTIRGRDIKIVNPHIRSTTTGFYVFTGYASGSGPAEDYFLAAAGPEFRTRCVIRGGDIETTGPILRRQYSETVFAGVDRMASPDPKMVYGPGIVVFSGHNNADEVGGGALPYVVNEAATGKGAHYIVESQFVIPSGGFVRADLQNAVARMR